MTRKIAILLLTLLFGWPRASEAEYRGHLEDQVVVERAELIVVARILPETIVRVEHEKETGRGRSWEFHATLLVSEVLKGTYEAKELPVVFEYGLAPRIGRLGAFSGDASDGRNSATVVEIYGGLSFIPRVPDAREETLWSLSRQVGKLFHRSGVGKYRLRDPEDIQPASKRESFLAYLGEGAEARLRELAAAGQGTVDGKRYLDHLEMERIRRIEDRAERFERLLPFFLDFAQWRNKWIAQDAMVECGAVCAKGLESTFASFEPGRLRQQIMRIWADLAYRPAIPLLIDWLEEAELFWAGETLSEGWWNQGVGTPETEKRRRIYGDVYIAAYALSRLPVDPAARPVLEALKERWQSFDNPQIAETAEYALGRISP